MPSSRGPGLLAGILLMIPGMITAVLVEGVPMRALIDPTIIATGIIGAIWNVDLRLLGLSLLYFLYFAGAVAVIVTLVNFNRNQ